MPRKFTPSPFDLRLLAELQANCRIEDAELAAKLKAPENVVCERIKWLEDQGIIEGYTTIVDYDAIDTDPLH